MKSNYEFAEEKRYDELDKIDVWNNAFVALEVLFDGNDINENLINVLKLVKKFMFSKDAFIYRIDNKTKKMCCYSRLEDEASQSERDYLKTSDELGRIAEINVNTDEYKYLVVITDIAISNDELYSKYISVLKRLFKLVFKRIEFQEKLIYASTTDSLTHAFNRTYYNMMSNEIFKNGDAMITYSLIDLFRLKYINDNYGHKYGDKYIVKVSELISKEIDSEDMLFRIGGDEFVILSKSLKKDDMLLKLNTVNKKLRKENLGLKIPFPLNINYGVIEGNGDLDKFYTEADEELSHHKALTYKKLKLDRRK